jgi:signal transduction histidine kinase
LSCRCVVLTVLDRTGGIEHFIAAGPDQQAVEMAGRLPVREGPLLPVVASAQVVRLSVGEREHDSSLPTAAVDEVLGVPVQLEDATLGGLYACDRFDGAAFTDADTTLAKVLADVTAAVIRRARLSQTAEQRQRWMAESADLTRALLSGEHPNPLHLVVERVRDIAESDLVAVVAERADRRSYEVIEAAGPYAAALHGRVVTADASLVSRVLAEGAPRIVSDLSSGNSHSDLAELVGADSAILAPLSGGGVQRGLLTMYRRPERPPFTDSDVSAAMLFTAQLTLALELADDRAKRERSALLDERGRIARDLHDHVIQRLFAIGLTLQSAATQADLRAGKRLQDSVAGIDETISQIRATIYRLTGPLTSAENSIRTRAARLVEDMTVVLGFRAELEVRGPIDFGVDDDVTDDCIAVLREALTNVAKHAGASRVDVAISVNASELALEVADDGCGIGAVSRRSGLANLRVRAERRQGRLIVASGAARGTRLTWTVPIGSGSRPVRSVG